MLAMRKVLLTGASGFLGWQIWHATPEKVELLGLYHRHPERLPARHGFARVDLTDRDAAWKIFKEWKPAVVLHLAAASSTNFCEQHPEEARKINVEAVEQLCAFCDDVKACLLFTSSGQVFDGLKEWYEEEDEPSPRNEYGRQKAAAEAIVRAALPQGCVVRVPVMFGFAAPETPNFMVEWLRTWEGGGTVHAFRDEERSFLSGAAAAEGLWLLVQQGAEGLFHLGGGEVCSRLSFARRLREVFGLPDAAIAACSREDAAMAAYRPPRVAFTNRKMRELGYRPRRLKEELQRLAALYTPPKP